MTRPRTLTVTITGLFAATALALAPTGVTALNSGPTADTEQILANSFPFPCFGEDESGVPCSPF